jgi:hypothetical protein
MLDPWIIEEIMRRESDRRQNQERPRAEVPLEAPVRYNDETHAQEDDSSKDRGVTVIDI